MAHMKQEHGKVSDRPLNGDSMKNNMSINRGNAWVSSNLPLMSHCFSCIADSEETPLPPV